MVMNLSVAWCFAYRAHDSLLSVSFHTLRVLSSGFRCPLGADIGLMVVRHVTMLAELIAFPFTLATL